jgi:hypothetical protein
MILEEILQKYPNIIGVNFDYIRYDDADKVEIDGTWKNVSWIVNANAVESFIKKVSEKFPKIILSADVMASSIRRKAVGQDGVLNYVDIILPMTYTKYGVDEVGTWISDIRSSHPNKKILALIRGWAYTQNSNGLLEDGKTDITSAKTAKSSGYAIFTYESLLSESNQIFLKDIKEKLGF